MNSDMSISPSQPRRCPVCDADLTGTNGNRLFCCEAHAREAKLLRMGEQYQRRCEENAEYRELIRARGAEVRRLKALQRQPRSGYYMGMPFMVEDRCLAIGQRVESWEVNG